MPHFTEIIPVLIQSGVMEQAFTYHLSALSQPARRAVATQLVTLLRRWAVLRLEYAVAQMEAAMADAAAYSSSDSS